MECVPARGGADGVKRGRGHGYSLALLCTGHAEDGWRLAAGQLTSLDLKGGTEEVRSRVAAMFR